MSVNLFDVDAAMIRDDYYPQLQAFTTDTNPTEATVDRWIDQEAAGLEGKLLNREIVAASITDDTSSAWLWCQKTLSLMVALRSGWPQAAGISKELRDAWAADLKDRLKDLDDNASNTLGSGAPSPTAEGNAAYSHIDAYGLEVSTATDASSVTPTFRKDDHL